MKHLITNIDMKKPKYWNEIIFFLVIIGGFTVLILIKIFLIK